ARAGPGGGGAGAISQRVAHEGEVTLWIRADGAVAVGGLDAGEPGGRDDESKARERRGEVGVVRARPALAVHDDHQPEASIPGRSVAPRDLRRIPELREQRARA